MIFRSHINSPEKGFTLIELMVVVAIISILASIAIPLYASFRLKTKTSEAKAMFSSVQTGQEAYLSENEVYLACLSSPGANGTAGPLKRPWIDNGGFTVIGFTPAGDVHYNYSVAVGPNAGGAAAREMAIEAEGDLDGNAAASYYTISSDGIVAGASSGVAPPIPWDIFHSGDEF
jgi:prepilin-type N-terminal cleavage/methylation domain-containing protein